MKKLPLGIQSFEKLRRGDYLYVDKTELIYKLVTEGVYYFLSRPRRFGKSLLCSTLESLFLGKKELFKGLWIEKSDWDWKKHPVIHINLSTLDRKTPDLLEQSLMWNLEVYAHTYDIDLSQPPTLQTKLASLITQLYEKHGPVVVLIDEYDKPILDHINDHVLVHRMRSTLRNFYTVLKSLDNELHFLLLTGVSKFSRVSIFSGLNNLEDITFSKTASTLCGYTENELTLSLMDHIKKIAQAQSISEKKVLDLMKTWYDGYRFSPALHNGIYNPFSVLSYLKTGNLRDYWFETGTPTFLLELIKKQQYQIADLDGTWLSETNLNTFDINLMPLESLLLQTGYLTIKNHQFAHGMQRYQLGYPNHEVTSALFNHLILQASNLNAHVVDSYLFKIRSALASNDLETLCQVFKSFFSQLRYDLHIPREKFYHALFYFILKFMGAEVEAEVPTNLGRIDATVHTATHIYIFELKFNKTPQKALDQIEEKKYYEKYIDTKKIITLVGISFNWKKRDFTMEWLFTPLTSLRKEYHDRQINTK